LGAWLLACAACTWLGCGAGDDHKVAVRAPTPAPDAGRAHDAGGYGVDAQIPGEIRGSTPVWPTAEQSLPLPYRAGPVRATLSLAPDPSQLDLHFNVDTTASFGGEIAAMQRELNRTIIPALRARVADTRIGVSRFADFPLLPFGLAGSRADVPYQLLCPVTDALARITRAVEQLDSPLGNGADLPEAGAESLYQIATGKGFMHRGLWLIPAFDPESDAAHGGGTLGGVGFRSNALRVVMHITDAVSHTPEQYAEKGIDNVHSMEEAASALAKLGVRVVGISTASRDDVRYSEIRTELSDLALATGASTTVTSAGCPTGVKGTKLPAYQGRCPWVFDAASDGSGLASSVVDAVISLLNDVHFNEVHAEPGVDPLGLIARLELTQAPQPSGLVAPKTADRLPREKPDGVPDTYLDVTRRQRLGFSVVFENNRLPPSDTEQHYRVSVRLMGDGVLLEERLLSVVVPASSQRMAATSDLDAGL
jgi:hypothetical protein